MKKLYYKFMMRLCWLLEDIKEFIFGIDLYDDFYPSSKWEDFLYDDMGNEK